MEDYLRVVIPYLHAELINSESLSQIWVLAQVLPPSPITFFECCLGDNQSQVDFQIGLSKATSDALIKKFLAREDWSSCGSFILDWIGSRSILTQYIRYIFLEFDLPIGLSQLPVPCIFLSPNQRVSTNPQDLAESVFGKFHYPISGFTKSNLSHCFDCLPAGARLSSLGLMMSRTNKPVKLVIQGTNLSQLLSYLAKLGWLDVASTFSSIASGLEKLVDSFRLSFDICDSVSPKVGLECFLLKQSTEESRWYKLLNYLVDIDVCTPVKRDALLTWFGFSQKADAPDNWPGNLIGGDLFLGSRALSVFWREISHIKIIYDLVENSLSAKGYLSFGHSWLDADLLATNSEIIKA